VRARGVGAGTYRFINFDSGSERRIKFNSFLVFHYLSARLQCVIWDVEGSIIECSQEGKVWVSYECDRLGEGEGQEGGQEDVHVSKLLVYLYLVRRYRIPVP